MTATTPGFRWTPEAVDILRRLHDKGDSSRVIADALARHFKVPLTRNAVIGKRMRLGLERSEEFKAKARATLTRKQAEARAREAERQRAIAERTATRLAAQRAADLERQQRSPSTKEDNVIVLSARIHPDSFSVAPKTMMDPRYCGCKWPLERMADNGDMLFCCNDTPDTLDSYCTAHKARAYQKTRTPARIKADQAIREIRIANARKMGLRQAFDFRAGKRAAR